MHFNPMDPAFVADPYPTYARLRAEDPVHRSPLGFWALTRYDDVVAVLRDPRSLKSPIAEFVAARSGTAPPPLSLLDMDPPDHTRLRALVGQAFTPGAVEAMRPRVEQIVADLLSRIAHEQRVDLIAQFAHPLPVVVICELLGVPAEDHKRFEGWGLDMARGLDAVMLPPGSPVATRSALAQQLLAASFRRLIAVRRAQPRGDLISALIRAESQGETLSEEELLSTCVLLFVAGHETTVNLIGNGMLALLRHPGELCMLREQPTLVASAVEELLRFDGPVQATSRFAREDMVVGGTTIAKGDMMMVFIGSADRDPAQFTDPDRLDIRRGDHRHLAFSAGSHFCLGAPVARMTGQIAINALVQRAPKIGLAAERPEFRESLTLRGLKSLPLVL